MRGVRPFSFLIVVLAVLLWGGAGWALDVDVKVSSFKMDLELEYAPGNLMDGDPATAWAGGSISSGEGQWMEFSFGMPVRVTRLGVYNGHQGEGQFEKFRRIRSGRVVYPDGTEFPFWLRDEMGEQIIECPGKPYKSLRIVVDTVFPEGAPLARMKLAVSEIKLYLTLMSLPDGAPAGAAFTPAPPPVDTVNPVPDEIKELLRTFYVLQTSLDEDYAQLFAPHVRDRFDFQFEVFKEMQRQRGTYRVLRTAQVDPSGLGFELVYLDRDVAEVRVFGSYRVQVANLDENLTEDSVFVLMKGTGGWKILELDGQEDIF
ncbi:discoidin domain-containing protein [Pseudodesulfovibrio indicus]|uniref:discoidin domain-containing protein n=1 Tax=Pseudodesulfovibrio indicus TaxID=1716143 RepID=UPI00292FB0BD|nr:discoidin domain-containing protein [Pseudodesulfovibrio indicus]